MSANDARAITKLDRKRYMESVQNDLNTAWQALLCLPEDHPRRQAGLTALTNAWETNQALASLIQDAETLLGACYEIMTELTDQRNNAMTELNDLVEALHNVWGTSNPRVLAAYNDIIEQHNAAFWESLPYDMASVLGGQWNFMEADTLYHVLTADIEEVSEDGSNFGFTPDQLVAFRANLLTMLKAFEGRAGHAPQLPAPEGDRHEDV